MLSLNGREMKYRYGSGVNSSAGDFVVTVEWRLKNFYQKICITML
jgi:hypothetical protein